jgi:hypothetical protein
VGAGLIEALFFEFVWVGSECAGLDCSGIDEPGDPVLSQGPDGDEVSARNHTSRKSLPAHLEHLEKVVACTPAQCARGGCGKDGTLIGYEKSEQLDAAPAKYFVVVVVAPAPSTSSPSRWSQTKSPSTTDEELLE